VKANKYETEWKFEGKDGGGRIWRERRVQRMLKFKLISSSVPYLFLHMPEKKFPLHDVSTSYPRLTALKHVSCIKNFSDHFPIFSFPFAVVIFRGGENCVSVT
jgi:hypothetical protein